MTTLPSCTCGQCDGCPDGWHAVVEECDCTADCVLGDMTCPACGYCSVALEGGLFVCKVCHEIVAAADLILIVDLPVVVNINPNPIYL